MREIKFLFQVSAEDFKKIPGCPIAYWVSDRLRDIFSSKTVSSIGQTRNGMTTGDNDTFLKMWHEVSKNKSLFNAPDAKKAEESGLKWFPYNKGGEARRWYGNFLYLVNWEKNGDDLKHFSHSILRNQSYYFKECITWSLTNSSKFGVRYRPCGSLFDVNGMSLFISDHSELLFVLGVLNSCVATHAIHIINPTISNQAGDIDKIPVIYTHDSNVTNNVEKAVLYCKTCWDSYETSWDFQENPLIDTHRHNDKQKVLSDLYGQVRASWEQQCETMRKLEVENNRIFIEIYGLQDELSPDVPWDEITLTCNPWYRYGKSPELDSDGQHFSTTGEQKVGTIFGMQPTGIKVSEPNQEMKVTSFPFNQELEDRLQKDTVKELISYAVGCMFGRYSLDLPGLAYAGGEWDASKYATFPADDDNIVPICDDDYFKDDLASRFVSFIETVFGTESLEENLNFIAKALGGRGSSREVIRKYFREDFFADHCKMYQKRPIYWLFDSGKKGGFRALIYMHRYQPDTLARLRTDYVHEQQERYRTAMADLTLRMDKASASEKIKLEKQVRAFREQAEETRLYEEKIHHLADKMISIDLDDGVKHNYAIFQDVLAKIK